jgi:endonuclease/exonuclease/phosphatase (EEP) superfamily protein YafD
MPPPAPKRLRIFRLAMLAMAAAGVAATGIAFLSDWYWYADLFAHLRPQYCVWLALTALGSVVVKNRPTLLLAIIGLLANAAALAPYALPWRDTAAAGTDERTWTFASINLLYGNREVSRVTGYVRRVQPDVVVFQEVSARWATDLEELRDLYPYRTTQSKKDSFGVAVFSRKKPVEVAIHTAGSRLGDLAVFGVWESDGQRFGVVGVHPDKPDKEWKTWNRRAYLGEVAQWCDARARAGEPVVVIGDFNATPWSASMKTFTRDTRLGNTSQGTIFGATWNVWEPHRLLIDHAFLSSHWKLHAREVGPNVGSDHRPLLIRAALRSAGAKASPSLWQPHLLVLAKTMARETRELAGMRMAAARGFMWPARERAMAATL